MRCLPLQSDSTHRSARFEEPAGAILVCSLQLLTIWYLTRICFSLDLKHLQLRVECLGLVLNFLYPNPRSVCARNTGDSGIMHGVEGASSSNLGMLTPLAWLIGSQLPVVYSDFD